MQHAMTTPDQTPEIELEAQELTDENLEEASGGAGFVYSAGYVAQEGVPSTDTAIDTIVGGARPRPAA